MRRGRAGGATRVIAVSLLGAAMLALQLALRGATDPETQVVGQLVAGAIFLVALIVAWRGLGAGWIGLAVVLVLAGAFRAAAFIPSDRTPPLSTDIHRYAWDGRIQLEGINPYRYAPTADETEQFRDDVVWAGINRPAWKTVYPPGAQASFAAAQWTFGDTLRSTTWLFLIAELGAIGLLVVTLRRLRAPPERVVAYAWHPLAISEIAGNGHVDALVIFAICALLAAWSYRRFVLAGAAVALATLVKLGPLVLIPALARTGRWRFTVAAVAITVAAYVPYAVGVGSGVFGSLQTFERLERFNGSLDLVVRPLVGREESQIILAVILGLVVALVAVRRHEGIEQLARSCLLVLGTLILVVDYVQPWHALWLTPLFAIVVAPGWLWLSLALPIAYVAATIGSLPRAWSVVIYGPVGLWALWRLRGSRHRPIPHAPLPSHPRVAAVIPALNEADALSGLLAGWPNRVVDEIIVVDGGSTDATREVAAAGGARVVVERRRGYGRACASGAAATDADVIVFLDGDGSCDPREIPTALDPVLRGQAELCLGERTRPDPGAMSPVQRIGNRLVGQIIGVAYGLRVRDVPCLRVIRKDALNRLGMREMTYGWPTEMLVRAARARLAITSVSVSFRRRTGGESKVSGRLGPSLRAGARMLDVALRDA